MRAAFLPAMADRSPGTQLCSHVSPEETEVSGMLWVAVAGDAERRTTDEGDVVRLRWVRRALPVVGDAVGVRELRHVRGGTVDVRDVMVLEEDDDELVEVVDGIDGHGLRTRRITGSGDREKDPGREHEHDQEKECDQGRGRMRSSPKPNSKHQRRHGSVPERPLYVDSDPAIATGCCNAEHRPSQSEFRVPDFQIDTTSR